VNPDASDYLAAVRRLPRPSLAQTERFARFVSNAHSWYKHLPIRPKVPFVFYLDPGAGMRLVRTGTGETALVEVWDERTRFHYTWQKTADYRRRFGHWAYHAAYGTSFLYAGEGGVVDSAGAGLRVLTESGDWAAVPPALAGKGTALVNAFVHPCPNFVIWELAPARYGLPEVAGPEAAGLPATARPVPRRLSAVLDEDGRAWPGPSEVVAALPPPVLEAVRRSAAGRPGPDPLGSHERDWDWPDEGWLEALRAAGVGAELVPWVVKFFDGEELRSLAEKMYRDRADESPGWPAGARRELVKAIAEERGRQLAAMTEAMGRFADAVYPAAADCGRPGPPLQ
jgi:hypothetical protein